jgi:outer membrane protein assembly factor BamB
MKLCAMYGADPHQSNYVRDARIQPSLELLWKFSPPKSIAKKPRPGNTYHDTPLAFGPRVFACKRSDGALPIVFCLSAIEGALVWTLENDIVERFTVSCVSRGVLILAGDGKVRARGINIESGRGRWSNNSVPLQSQKFCVGSGDVVFCGRAADSMMYGILQPQTGDFVWSRKTLHGCRAAAACDAGLLFVEDRGCDRFNGVVCRDSGTGEDRV